MFPQIAKRGNVHKQAWYASLMGPTLRGTRLCHCTSTFTVLSRDIWPSPINLNASLDSSAIACRRVHAQPDSTPATPPSRPSTGEPEGNSHLTRLVQRDTSYAQVSTSRSWPSEVKFWGQTKANHSLLEGLDGITVSATAPRSLHHQKHSRTPRNTFCVSKHRPALPRH